jgi:GDPmannose 4,6-dehydratase
MLKTALILGITGQDGAYLAQFLLEKGYDVVGTSRQNSVDAFWRLNVLAIKKNVRILQLDPTIPSDMLDLVNTVKPDEIYHLSGQSSVALSFQNPQETLNSILSSTLNVLDAMRASSKKIKLFFACSGECFGATESDANEQTLFQPESPYASAKASAYALVHRYRESEGVFACSGILFNHESPLRPVNYVTRKITQAAAYIKQKKQDKLMLGDLTIQRDWGYSPDYVEAMYLMLQQDKPEDYVLATGRGTSIADICEIAFSHVGLDYHEYVETDPAFVRPNDKMRSVGNPLKAKQQLAWQAKTNAETFIPMMVDYDL